MNSFEGDIPQSFGDLKGLDMLNLSYNNLSGTIPKSLEVLSHLKYLNVSFNKPSGEIPSNGPFANFTAESFLGNKGLCGNSIFGVRPCKNPSSQESGAIIFAALVYMLRKHRKSKMQNLSSPSMGSFLTDHCCCQGILSDGIIVAVRVLNLQLDGAFKSFDAECKVLRTIRHRNLVKVISTCSNPEFRALILQYMANGSLEKYLYHHNYCLNLLQRVNIMIGIALALEYLHHDQSEPVVHCDLKPNNILLDEDMVAHVSDFGLAKILIENKDTTQTKTLGTLGYIAPGT
ncbi:probable LRR receptor-like serine/threonine-protein kinase At3g47570 [Juglans microcarpa x Juglans regia]|uniref:probable LRR receptor-like serine/threonine-protein kinase At3g47570 n=1 Tax=Juglans microcarpa x Juglans regia TaxID=2249226 RepID=UPI001B7ED81D|nr:probable LRR receptor-like serine/threonine-protein kinase At3g47570 [Juglans microcarpa x Juglans regia]